MSMQLHVYEIMTKPTDNTINAWVGLVRAHTRALSTIEAALKQAGLPVLEWYDVLLELERAEDQGIRPFELQNALLLPQYGISRLVDRLEKAGHLKRASSTDDGRGQLLFITATGKDVRRQMWSVYAAAIEEGIGSKLSPMEAETLAHLLSRLTD